MKPKGEIIDKFTEIMEKSNNPVTTGDGIGAICVIAIAAPFVLEVLIDIREIMYKFVAESFPDR